MPTQRISDISIYHEVHGDGPQTVVLIHGLTLHSGVFREQTPEFCRHFRTVLFDNRGAGRTDKPDEPYTMRQFAADTAALMNVLQIQRAAVVGVSMGGMIAQEFALNYPERLSLFAPRLYPFWRQRRDSAATRNRERDRRRVGNDTGTPSTLT